MIERTSKLLLIAVVAISNICNSQESNFFVINNFKVINDKKVELPFTAYFSSNNRSIEIHKGFYKDSDVYIVEELKNNSLLHISVDSIDFEINNINDLIGNGTKKISITLIYSKNNSCVRVISNPGIDLFETSYIGECDNHLSTTTTVSIINSIPYEILNKRGKKKHWNYYFFIKKKAKNIVIVDKIINSYK